MNKFEIRIVPDNLMIPIAVSAAQQYARYYFTREKDIAGIATTAPYTEMPERVRRFDPEQN